MTDQIERELSEMFRERAVRLDVLPPLPAARVRRARLHTALAMASVVAVLASVGVAGMRLTSGPGTGRASIAASGSPRSALERVAQRMLLGHWRVVVTARGLGNAGPGPSDVIDAEYDGATKAGLAHEGGKLIAEMAGGVSYTPVPDDIELARFLPKGAHWFRTNRTMFGADPTGVIFGMSGEASGSGSDANTSSRGAVDGMTVRRNPRGFSITAKFGGEVSRTDVVLRADGSIASTHTETAWQGPIGPNGPTSGQPETLDAVYTPVSTPLHVSAPDPATVITEAQFRAAISKAMTPTAITPGGLHCPSVATHSTTVRTHRTQSGGSVTTGQSSTMLSCRMVVTVHPSSPVATPRPH